MPRRICLQRMGSLIAKGEDFSVVIVVWTENATSAKAGGLEHRLGKWRR